MGGMEKVITEGGLGTGMVNSQAVPTQDFSPPTPNHGPPRRKIKNARYYHRKSLRGSLPHKKSTVRSTVAGNKTHAKKKNAALAASIIPLPPTRTQALRLKKEKGRQRVREVIGAMLRESGPSSESVIVLAGVTGNALNMR